MVKVFLFLHTRVSELDLTLLMMKDKLESLLLKSEKTHMWHA